MLSAPKLKGRPRKRRKVKRPGSPESESASSESSISVAQREKENSNKENGGQSPIEAAKPASKKDLLAILSQKNTREETEFLKKLITFMEKRNTPIERPPMMGFKQSE